MAATQAKVAPWPAIPTPKPEEVYAGLSDQAKAYPLFLESIVRARNTISKNRKRFPAFGCWIVPPA